MWRLLFDKVLKEAVVFWFNIANEGCLSNDDLIGKYVPQFSIDYIFYYSIFRSCYIIVAEKFSIKLMTVLVVVECSYCYYRE